MDESQNNYADWRKPEKESILYYLICIKIWENVE
jgi:hypothetical protein